MASFEDMFDGTFSAARKLSKRATAPLLYPKSASEMRKHTVFSQQGIPATKNGDGVYQNVKARSKMPAKTHTSRLRTQANAQKSTFAITARNTKAATVSGDSRQWDWSGSSSA
ncbi:MAG: hypothetical protein KGL39_01700 [Patescibacteria group bacterium]|nr:hypothetical protein [Patescibacteria group bacterium]